MADLIVTSETLDESKLLLSAILAEFRTSGARVKEDADVWGQKDLAHAMSQFVKNWKIHRGKIVDSAEILKKNMQDAIDGWNQADTGLADSLETEST